MPLPKFIKFIFLGLVPAFAFGADDINITYPDVSALYLSDYNGMQVDWNYQSHSNDMQSLSWAYKLDEDFYSTSTSATQVDGNDSVDGSSWLSGLTANGGSHTLYVALLDQGSNVLATDSHSFTYQSGSSGTQSGDGGTQSPDGGYQSDDGSYQSSDGISIHYPNVSILYSSDYNGMQVDWNYQSQSNDMQSLSWAYKLDEDFYSTSTSATQVDGNDSVDGSSWLSGLTANGGSHTLYVALLDQGSNVLATDSHSFTYQSGSSGTQSGDGGTQSPDGGYQSDDGSYQSSDGISIHYPNVSILYSSDYNGMQVGWNYQSQSNDMQSLSWAYKLDEDFYSTSTSATQVDGNDSVDGSSWLSGLTANGGSHTLYVALLDQGSNVLATDSHSFTYQSGSSGTQSGDGGTQSPDGGYQSDDGSYQSSDGISIHYPNVSILYSSDYNGMQVDWNYQSHSNDMQSLSWAYKLDEDFYSTSTSATQVDGNDSVDGSSWLSGLTANGGSHTLYVALLDQGSNVLATDSHSFTYQSGSSGTQSGDGGTQSPDGGYQSDDGSYQSSDGISIHYPNVSILYSSDYNGMQVGWNYQSQSNDMQSLSWAYKLDEDFYSTSTSATQVDGNDSVDGSSWLSGLTANGGSHTLYVALLDQGSNVLATDSHSFTYQSGSSGTQSGDGGTQSPDGGYQSDDGSYQSSDGISIHYPNVSILYSSDYNGMQVDWNYQSHSNDMQSLSWAYKLDEDFYSTSTSATQVDGNDSVDGSSWLSGLTANGGSHTLYVALLDQGSNVLATDSHSFTYQSGSSGTQSGDGGTQSPDGGYQSDDGSYQSSDGISIHYPNVSILYSSDYNGMQVDWNYQSHSNDMQSLSWAYKLDEDFYSTSTSATQVDGNDSVDGSSWLSGLTANGGSHTLYVALLDQGSNVLATDSHSFTYQSGSSGTQSGDGGTQSPDGGYQSDDGSYQSSDGISIHYPNVSILYSSDYNGMQVDWNYQSHSNDMQSLSWAYKLDEDFYSTSTSATQVDGNDSVDGSSWLSGLSADGGSHTLYVALLDQGSNVLATDSHSFTYQSGSSGTQSGDGGTQSPDGGYQSDDGSYQSSDGISIHYPNVYYLYSSGGSGLTIDWNYQSQDNGIQSLSWAYKLNEDFYGTSTSATQVSGTDSVDGSTWLSGLSTGVEHTLYVALLDQVSGDVLDTDEHYFTYESGDGGYQSGGDRYQSDDGGYNYDEILINYPNVYYLYSSGGNGLAIDWNYQSQDNGIQSLSWAYKLNEDFYGTSTSATQVSGSDSVDGSTWLSGLSTGVEHTLYVALLDQVSGDVLDTDEHYFWYNAGSDPYSSGGDGYQSGDGTYQSDTGAINEIFIESPTDNAYLYGSEALSVSIQYSSDITGYSSPRWGYKIDDDFYSSQTSAIEVQNYFVDDWLDGLSSGSHTLYVALLDPHGGDQILAEDSATFEYSAPNSPPTNLVLSNNTVDENVPHGTEIGVFSATDVDGDTLHYHMYQLGESPDTLTGLKAHYNDRIFSESGEEYESGYAYFYDTNFSSRSSDSDPWEEEGYVYEKTGTNTGTLTLNNGAWVSNLQFDENNNARGEWSETDGQNTWNGYIEIYFEKTGESPESLDGLYGHLSQNTHESESYTITLGEYILENGEYVYTGVDRTFSTDTYCQIEERVAGADEHNNGEQIHYYAVAGVWYNGHDHLEWLEYGPSEDAASAEEMCHMATEGTHHSVNDFGYTQVGDVYLKITSAEANKPWLSDYRRDHSINDINESVLISHYWDDALETEVQTQESYLYEKTGVDTGLLTLPESGFEIELTFNPHGNAYGYSEWNASLEEGNITGWIHVNIWGVDTGEPYEEYTSPVRLWLDSDGTLRTDSEIDYESGQTSVGIVVSVDDHQGGMLREQFEISILDVFEDFDQDEIEDHLDPDDDNDGFTDQEEVAAGTDPYDANSAPNSPPTNLVLSNNTVDENVPHGTEIGVFSATDVDGDTLHYHMYQLGESPDTLTGLKAHYNDRIFSESGEEYESGYAYFYDTNFSSRSSDSDPWEEEGYVYEKTGTNTGTLTLNNGAWVSNLQFDENNNARGEWSETDGQNTWNGYIEIYFEKTGESPESLDGLYGHLSQNTHESESYTITLGEYILENGEYVYTGVDRTFSTDTYCQIEERVAGADEHNNGEQIHYYAVAGVWYNGHDHLEWLEYGPSEDAASAEEMCHMATEGTHHSVNDFGYTQVGDVYLKITSAEANKPWLSDYRRDHSINDINESVLISHYWDDALETEVQTQESYLYEKTGVDTGLLTLPESGFEIELTFNPHGNAYGYSEWNASLEEGNITGWIHVNIWGVDTGEPYEEYTSPVRLWLDSDGTLRTDSEIDYESGQTSVGIVVSVDDHQGGMLREQFEISILDVFEDFDQDEIEDHLDPDDDNDGFPDEDEIMVGTNPLDAESKPNGPPTNLVLSSNTIEENTPWNTQVGVFSATDPDGDYLYYNSEQLGESPENLSGVLLEYTEWEYRSFGTHHTNSGRAEFSDSNFSYWDEQEMSYISKDYTYVKNGPSSGLLSMDNGAYVAELYFTIHNSVFGEWEETLETGTITGKLEFNIRQLGNSPESISGTRAYINLRDFSSEWVENTHREGIFSDLNLTYYDHETQTSITESYEYVKTGESTALLTFESGDSIELIFGQHGNVFGSWENLLDPDGGFGEADISFQKLGICPESLSGYSAWLNRWQEYPIWESYHQDVQFFDNFFAYWDANSPTQVEESYQYTKTGSHTATITFSDGAVADLLMDEHGFFSGRWEKTDENGVSSGGLDFHIPIPFQSPESIIGLRVYYDQIEFLPDGGEEYDHGEVDFFESELSYWDDETQSEVLETYQYTKTGETSATLITDDGNFTILMTFESSHRATGSWEEITDNGVRSGEITLYFDQHEDDNNNYSETYFWVESNGTLRSNRPLDFESDPHNYTLLVTVNDYNGGSIRDIFEITLIDVVENFDGDELEDHLDPDDDNDGYTDEEELVAGTDPLDAQDFPNQPPHSLSLDNNRILENSAPGTIVGTFNAIDPDGDDLSFHLNFREEHHVGDVLAPDGSLIAYFDGSNYRWAENLDGLILWSVDFSGGEGPQSITMRFENGRNFGNLGLLEDVALPQPYDHAYIIDENGHIRVSEEAGYQYYNIVSYDPEFGIIETIEGGLQDIDDYFNSPDQFFFTNREQAQAFYDMASSTDPNSYDPSLSGESMESDPGSDGIHGTDDDIYYGDDTGYEDPNLYDPYYGDPTVTSDPGPDGIHGTDDDIYYGDDTGYEDPNFDNPESFYHDDYTGDFPFVIDDSGNLVTTRELDFETDATWYEVSVVATDPHGGYHEVYFDIELVNVVEDLDGDGDEDHFDLDDDGDGFSDEEELGYGFDPRNPNNRPELAIVQTLSPYRDAEENFVLSGRLLSLGGLPLTELGFIINGGSYNEEYLIVDTVISEGSEFSTTLPNPEPGVSYTYRAFGYNVVGQFNGAPRNINIKQTSGDWWFGADELETGWKSNWFGVFLPQPNGWAYHTDLGWAFISPDSDGGIWFWVEDNGWHWTRDGIWSFMWSNNTSDWMYLMKSGTRTFIYDYSTESFITDF